jgi:hypothetical protein
MRHPQKIHRARRMLECVACTCASCSGRLPSKDNANGMTSFSSKASPSATPQLFTLPAGPDEPRADW